MDDTAAIAYDEDLANRIRELIAAEPDVAEKKMFGGLAFLIGGNMAVAASGQGGLMVRCDPQDTEKLVAKPGARPFEMRGREMSGWLRVDDDAVRTKRLLAPWVRVGVGYARSLPPK
jgi:TfoX/Sxy family transcriptional regulator of competence genes